MVRAAGVRGVAQATGCTVMAGRARAVDSYKVMSMREIWLLSSKLNVVVS